MSEHKIEDLSALIDGEHAGVADEVIDRICEDGHLRQTWARYHLISDCLKGQLPEHISMKVGDRIQRALDAEPVILAPKRRVYPYLKPVAGFAIAASVAVMAILGIQHNNASLSDRDTGPLAANQPAQGKTQQFTFAPTRLVQHPQTVSSDKVNANSRMNSYLVNHNEQRSSAGIQGMFPYVRIVAHEKQE